MKKSLIIGIIIGIVVIGIVIATSLGSPNTPQNVLSDAPQNITVNLKEGLSMSAP